MDDDLRARAERLKQMCNALANLHAYKLTNLGSRRIDFVHTLTLRCCDGEQSWNMGYWQMGQRLCSITTN